MAERLTARQELLRTAPQPTQPSSAGSRPGCPSHPWPLCGRSPLPAGPVPSLGSEADRHILFFSPSVLPCSHRGRATLQAPRFARFGHGPWLPLLASSRRGGASQGRLGLSGALEAVQTGTAVGKQRRGWKRGAGSRLHPPVPGGARLPLPGRKGHPAGPRHARSRNPGRVGAGWGGAQCALIAGVPTISGASGMPLAGPAPPPLCLRGAQGCTGRRRGLEGGSGTGLQASPPAVCARWAPTPGPQTRVVRPRLCIRRSHFLTPGFPSFLGEEGGEGEMRDKRECLSKEVISAPSDTPCSNSG